ncbi:MAG TPA: tetratricopeptide repeat protein [Terracidiphilus sp.]|nr:tetratricopeptide repeat protein [Terracidiphilus sp.]
MMNGLTQGTKDDEGVKGNLTALAVQCQHVLEQDPRQLHALVGIAMVALASGQVNEGVKMAEAAVAVAPERCASWVALGQALKAAGHLEDAEQAYRAALKRDGMNALARTGLGELMTATGRAEEALTEFALALRKWPAMVAALMGQAHALAFLQRDDEALASYEAALAQNARLAEAEFGAGFVLARMGRLEAAGHRYRRAVRLRPDFAAAWMNLGCILRELPMIADAYAEAALTRAVELRPDMVTGWLNRALLKREQGRLAEAEEDLQKAICADPTHVETLVAWSQLALARGDMRSAWDWARQAKLHGPQHAEAVNMEGILLHGEQRFKEAEEAFARAEQLGSRAAASNRGNSLMDMGCPDEAIAAHEAAVQADPRNAGPEYNLALAQLRTGDWEHGWKNYEARWRFREVHRSPMQFSVPRWRGELLDDRRILLHAEQGLGDVIQFSRYAVLVAARGGKIVLQVHAAAERLMRSLAVVRTGQAIIAPLGKEPPEFAVECPLMSLPAVFGTMPGEVPWSGPYLAAEDALTAKVLKKYPCMDGRLRIGIAWAGNPKYRGDAQRSTRLETLIPLLRGFQAEWFSLQKGEAVEQVKQLPKDVTVHDACSRDKGLADTAAVIATLDLVVTTDTCIAHLAGAMGKPVWILLPYRADWRWMLGTDETPWYPTARLLRQGEPDGWAELVERVVGELRQFRSSN